MTNAKMIDIMVAKEKAKMARYRDIQTKRDLGGDGKMNAETKKADTRLRWCYRKLDKIQKKIGEMQNKESLIGGKLLELDDIESDIISEIDKLEFEYEKAVILDTTM